jgi:quinol monooxygenase YgiN
MNSEVVRIVTMSFKPERVEDFLALFDERSGQIRSFPGCMELDLVQSTKSESVFSTISIWSSEDALEAYRSSTMFEETWAKTKEMFAERPSARTYRTIRRVNPLS